jgi:hypothetical protein
MLYTNPINSIGKSQDVAFVSRIYMFALSIGCLHAHFYDWMSQWIAKQNPITFYILNCPSLQNM